MAPKRAVNAPSAPSPSTSAFSSSASTTLSSGPKTLSANSSVLDIAVHVWQQYLTTTPQRTLLLDAFMAFLVLVGGVQFAYCVLAGNYPFNAFLSGFCAAVGQFVLTASLRMQTSSVGGASGKGASSVPQKAGKGAVGWGKDTDGVSHESSYA